MIFDFSNIRVQHGLQTASAHVDPKAAAAGMAMVGAQVRARLKAMENAVDLGGDKADLFRIPQFLSAEECARICRVIDRKIGPSPLFEGTEIGGFRTSSTHYFDRNDPETSKLEAKIDSVLGLDHRFAETTQGQRYEVGQQFKHHYDYFAESEPYWQTERRRGGQRTWTAMVFLNEPAAGGETDFKELGLAIVPERGTLLTWNNLDRDGHTNPATLHAGTPVIEGRKYVITQWYRHQPWNITGR